MEMRKMNLTGGNSSRTSSTNKEDYFLNGSIYNAAMEMLKKEPELEYWSPVYQAWEPLLMKYLKTGSVPELTTEHLNRLYDKVDRIEVPTNGYTQFYCDIHALYNTSYGELFKLINHDMVIDFCQRVCQFFMSQRRIIWRDMHSADIMDEVMEGLLNINTHRSLMCASMLLRTHRARDYKYKAEYKATIRERLDKWIAEYTQEFNRVYALLGDQREFYIWYCPAALDCMQRAVRDCTEMAGIVFMTPEISRREPEPVKAAINAYLSVSPWGTRPLASKSYAFDAMYKMFYDNHVEDPRNTEGVFHALCIGRSSFDTMCNYLNDFYGSVQYCTLGQKLLERIQAMADNDNLSITPEEYRASLLYRGFPMKDA